MIAPKVPEGFRCLKCGNCCTIKGFVNLQYEDIGAIAKYLGLSVEEFTAAYTDLNDSRRGLRLKDHNDGSCIFLGNDRSCLINEVKPSQCRGFPHEWNYNDWQKVCSYNYNAPSEGHKTNESCRN